MTWLWLSCMFVGGYVASIYSWPTIRGWVNGLEAEAAALREKARAIEAAIRSKL